MQDVDAPTGSGFWHRMSWDIPATERGVGHTSPAGAVAGMNDAGILGYLGPRPPAGDIAHRYMLTVYALDTPSVGLPAGTPGPAPPPGRRGDDPPRTTLTSALKQP